MIKFENYVSILPMFSHPKRMKVAYENGELTEKHLKRDNCVITTTRNIFEKSKRIQIYVVWCLFFS